MKILMLVPLMNKRKFITMALTVSLIVATSILLFVRLPRTNEAEIEIVTVPQVSETEIYTESVSQVIVIDSIVNPVPASARPVYYDIPFSDEEQDLIRTIASNYGIDYELVLAIIKTESNFNPNQIGDYGNSFGLMQVQPRYWNSLFNQNNCSGWFSVKDNVTVGCAILWHLYGACGDTEKVLSAYNSGNPDNQNGYSQRVFEELEVIKNLKR